MREIKVKQQFLDSVLEIRDYISQDSPQNAADFVSGLKSKMQKIVEQPETPRRGRGLRVRLHVCRWAERDADLADASEPGQSRRRLDW